MLLSFINGALVGLLIYLSYKKRKELKKLREQSSKLSKVLEEADKVQEELQEETKRLREAIEHIQSKQEAKQQIISYTPKSMKKPLMH